MLLNDASTSRPSFSPTISLAGSHASMYGKGWLKHWAMIPDGTYTVDFVIRFIDGEIRNRITSITIKDSVIDKFTPGGSGY